MAEVGFSEVEKKQQVPENNFRNKINHFILKVREEMTPEEINNLPYQTPEYVNTFVGRGLNNLDKYGEDLKDLVVSAYNENQNGERFIFNPKDGGTLFVNGNELVSLKDVAIGVVSEGLENAGTRYIKEYKSYEVLTGENKGKVFGNQERPIPYPPKPGTASVQK